MRFGAFFFEAERDSPFFFGIAFSGVGEPPNTPLNIFAKRDCVSFSENFSESFDLADEPEPELVNDPSDIVWSVPGSIQRRIGSAVVECSRLEHTLEIVIWAYLKLNSEDGKMLTSRMDMNRRQALIKELIARYPKGKTNDQRTVLGNSPNRY